MNEQFVVWRIDDNVVLGVGTIKYLSWKCKIHCSSLREHYRDRDNINRFYSCNWKIDTVESVKRRHPEWKLTE